MSASREIEARFVQVDVPGVLACLHELGAEDLGEDLFREIIFYDAALTWQQLGRTHVRLRHTQRGIILSYKQVLEATAGGTIEIQFNVDDFSSAKEFLEQLGLVAFREQEKKRHTFHLDGTIIDIDTWPGLPPYVEIEGPNEETIRAVAARLGFDWATAEFGSAADTIERHFNVQVRTLRFFTFQKVA